MIKDSNLGLVYEEFINKVKEIIPTATFDTDNHGQIIIYTDLMMNEINEDEEVIVLFDLFE